MKPSDIAIIRRTMAARPVRYAALFGSQVRGNARPDSDIDLLVDYQPDYRYSLLDLADLKLSLEEGLGRSVDVVTKPAAQKKLLKIIGSNLQTIYER